MTNKYVENYPLRKRTFHLEDDGVVVVERGFFKTTEYFVPYESIGRYVQYKKEADIVVIGAMLAMLTLGLRGILRNDADTLLFLICLALIIIPLIKLANAVSKVEYAGGYYFSNGTGEGTITLIEIKSKYPANEELQQFLKRLRELQVKRIIENLFSMIDEDYYPVGAFLNELGQLKNQFDLDEQDYQYWVYKARESGANHQNE